jgi:hypothetical protein
MNSIELLDVSFNKPSKSGLSDLLKELIKCKFTLSSLNISNNKGGDQAVPQII